MNTYKYLQKVNLIGLLLFSLILTFCSNPKKDLIHDIIPNQNLTAGSKTEIIISDLFYSENYDVAVPIFINKHNSFERQDREMKKIFKIYGSTRLMGNIMDSHDKNRFMAYADGDLDVSQGSAIEIGWNNPPKVDNPENYKKLLLNMAYINTIPCLPVIYYGSEFGITGATDPDNGRMMRFDDDISGDGKETLSEVSEIIKILSQPISGRYS